MMTTVVVIEFAMIFAVRTRVWTVPLAVLEGIFNPIPKFINFNYNRFAFALNPNKIRASCYLHNTTIKFYVKKRVIIGAIISDGLAVGEDGVCEQVDGSHVTASDEICPFFQSRNVF